jgi:hypothetical protein
VVVTGPEINPLEHDRNMQVLAMVVEYERVGWTHERAVGLAASRLGMRVVDVTDACNRAINPPDGMWAP